MAAIAISRFGGTNVIAFEGDVTRQRVEAVVNSANEVLQHTEQVAAAVVRTGGRVIQEESNAWIREHGPVAPGSVAITTGGMLHASHVIHAVGPYFEEGVSDAALAGVVAAALDMAVEHDLTTIAFPMISSGQRGYPDELAATVITGAVRTWLEAHPDVLTEVRLVGFGPHDAELFAAALR